MLMGVSALFVGVAACSDVSDFYTAGDYQFEMQVDTLTREFTIHIPADLDPNQPAPLLFVIHGTGSNGSNTRKQGEVDRFADPAGVVTVYPEAGSLRAWAVPGTAGRELGVDDQAFFNLMIDRITEELNVDESRMFIAGISNGGLLAQWVGCQLNDRLLGFASIGATALVEISDDCVPTRAMPALFFLGTEDPIFWWDGLVGTGFETLSAEATVARYAALNGCSNAFELDSIPDFVPRDSSTVRRWRYSGCTGGTEVLLYGVDGGSHTWPGSPFEAPLLGCTTRDIHATQLIVDFLISGGTVAPANTAAGDSTSRGCEKPFV
jgi:polyhydroxybutyrate depolymerase